MRRAAIGDAGLLKESGGRLAGADTSPGIKCKLYGSQYCHGTVVRRFGPSYAKVCSDGKTVLMKIPP